jgi:Anti-sigma factor NepR
MAAREESEIALAGMERDEAPVDLKAVRTGIGAALQALYSEILREELADRIAELVRQLDQRLKQLDQHKDTDGT